MASSRIQDLQAGGEKPAPAKLFPQWSDVEQDFWLDMFEQYSDTMLHNLPEEDMDLNRAIEKAGGEDEFYKEKIRLAALLADKATQEMIYRFERQKPLATQRRASGCGPDDKTKKRRRSLW